MKKYWLWISAGLLTMMILIVGLWQWKGLNPAAETLSKTEAQKLIEKRYKGKVTQINLDGAQYVAEMTREASLYQIKLDINSGEVLSIDITGQVENQPDPSPAEEKPKPQQPQQPANGNESTPIITQEDAVQIALKQVTGNIDEVELEQEDSFPYYLVEIETADDREAVIQIHAITGEVLSVSWDD